ncbi:hypothetical protein B0H13DRAFT_1937559 [Mycena leptocephala]|nr:hypothetical protein B0H13DRAFT_1937559 [Mycena leptocephala]
MSQMTTVTAQSASSHSKSNIGIIVGSIVGGLVVVILAIFAWLYSRRVRHVSPENEPARGSQFLRIEDYPVQHALYTREVGAPVSVPTTGSNIHTGLAGPSAVSLLTPSDGSSAAIPTVSASPGPAPEVQPPAPINTRSRDSGLRLMEERLAVLEAQVAVQQEPPPYVHEDDD